MSLTDLVNTFKVNESRLMSFTLKNERKLVRALSNLIYEDVLDIKLLRDQSAIPEYLACKVFIYNISDHVLINSIIKNDKRKIITNI
jgi:hypothetical protein